MKYNFSIGETDWLSMGLDVQNHRGGADYIGALPCAVGQERREEILVGKGSDPVRSGAQ